MGQEVSGAEVKNAGTSPVVQQLTLHASTAGALVPSLVRELRSCMPQSKERKFKKKKKKNNPNPVSKMAMALLSQWTETLPQW